MSNKPNQYPTWSQGLPTQISAPTQAQQQSGFAAERPSYQLINWLFWNLGSWVSYLDTTVTNSALVSSIEPSIRLLGGGVLSWSAQNGVLSWSEPLILGVPGLQDAANTIAAGSVTLTPGQIAYVQANIPWTVKGTLTQGSNQVTGLASMSGIETGQQVEGPGIANGTTVAALAANYVTLSQAATQSGTDVSLTFTPNGTLSVQAGDRATLAVTPQTLVLAASQTMDGVTRALVGVNAPTAAFYDQETKSLYGDGYLQVVSYTAATALVANTAVYVAQTQDGGRTPGQLYPADTSSPVRARAIGFAPAGIASGASGLVVCSGTVGHFTGLVDGATYWLDPSNPGQITPTKPAATGVYATPLGTALGTTQLRINAAAATDAQQVTSVAAWPQYAVANETQFAAALVATKNAGGGVILLSASFTPYNNYTVPSGTVLLGRKGAVVLTLSAGCTLTLADGAEVKDVTFSSPLGGTSTLVALSNNFAHVDGCFFQIAANNTTTAILVTGNSNRIDRCVFTSMGAAGCIGINYASGADNVDTSSVFLD